MPDSLTLGNSHALYVEREDCARKQVLDADTPGGNSAGIGGVDGVNNDPWEGNNARNAEGCVEKRGAR